jgi:phage-related protein
MGSLALLYALFDTVCGVSIDTMNGVKRGSWRWVYYKAPSGRVPVREFIDEQTAIVQEKMFSDLARLVRFNIQLGPPYVEKVEGRDFWELRTRVRGDIYRTFYFAHTGRRFVLLHAYQKKSQKAPTKELDVAQERMTDYLRRSRAKAQRRR